MQQSQRQQVPQRRLHRQLPQQEQLQGQGHLSSKLAVLTVAAVLLQLQQGLQHQRQHQQLPRHPLHLLMW